MTGSRRIRKGVDACAWFYTFIDCGADVNHGVPGSEDNVTVQSVNVCLIAQPGNPVSLSE